MLRKKFNEDKSDNNPNKVSLESCSLFKNIPNPWSVKNHCEKIRDFNIYGVTYKNEKCHIQSITLRMMYYFDHYKYDFEITLSNSINDENRKIVDDLGFQKNEKGEYLYGNSDKFHILGKLYALKLAPEKKMVLDSYKELLTQARMNRVKDFDIYDVREINQIMKSLEGEFDEGLQDMQDEITLLNLKKNGLKSG